MQLVSSRFWTRVVVSISYDDNHYTTGTSSRKIDYSYKKWYRQHKHQENKNDQKTQMDRKNISIDYLCDEQAKSYARKLGYG